MREGDPYEYRTVPFPCFFEMSHLESVVRE